MGGRPGALAWAVAVGSVALQALALYWPSVPDTGVSIPGADKVVHVVLFGLHTWALARVAGLRWAVLLMGGHALASELVQGFVVGTREADPLDLLADAVGVVVGAAAARRWSNPV